MLVVVEVVVADKVVEVVAAVEVEADTVEKGLRIRAAHSAEWITTLPKTAESVKGSNPDGSSNHRHSHANVREMPTMKMMSSAIIVVNPVTCAMNAN